MLVVNHAKCNTFLERLGTLHIFVLTAKIWSLQVPKWGSNLRSKHMLD
jgi:hypothetical protein